MSGRGCVEPGEFAMSCDTYVCFLVMIHKAPIELLSSTDFVLYKKSSERRCHVQEEPFYLQMSSNLGLDKMVFAATAIAANTGWGRSKEGNWEPTHYLV